jgi:hypothetical protein
MKTRRGERCEVVSGIFFDERDAHRKSRDLGLGFLSATASRVASSM